MPGLFWYQVVCSLITMAFCAVLFVAIGGLWINVFEWGWWLATAGALAGLVSAIILWRQDDD